MMETYKSMQIVHRIRLRTVDHLCLDSSYGVTVTSDGGAMAFDHCKMPFFPIKQKNFVVWSHLFRKDDTASPIVINGSSLIQNGRYIIIRTLATLKAITIQANRRLNRKEHFCCIVSDK